MKIAVDLDEITLNYVDPFMRFVNLLMGTKYTRKDHTQYSFEDCGIVPKGTNGAWISLFGQGGNLRKLELVPGAKENIEKLEALGHEIVFVTSRNAKYAEDTEFNLDSLGLGDHVVYYSTRAHGKAAVILEIGADILIDDSPEFIIEVQTRTKATGILMTNVIGSINKVMDSKCRLPILASFWDQVYTYIENWEDFK